MMENILHLDYLNISFLGMTLYCTIVLQDVTNGVRGKGNVGISVLFCFVFL